MNNFIKENWNKYTRDELALRIGISLGSLYKKAKDLGIVIDKDLSFRAKTPRWSQEEINFLKENYYKLNIKEISLKLNRTATATYIKIRQVGLKPKSCKWTEKELKLLKQKYSNSNTKELINLFSNHTIGSINKKAKSLGLERKNVSRPQWTEEEKIKVIEFAEKGYTDEQIAKKLNRGIERVSEIRRTKITKLWSKEEELILKENYSNKLIQELEALFPNRNRGQIMSKASRMKLKKDEETFKKCFNIKTKFPKKLNKNGYWRTKILKRDEFCCKLCGFKDETSLKLQAHHIKPARDCNEVERYDINNGICLCLDCHSKVNGCEYKYVSKFINLMGAR